MRLETKKYLYDIERAAGQIAEFTAGKQFSDYEREAMLRLAVERAFAIIGEALARLAKIDAPVAARISEHERTSRSATSSSTPTPRSITGWFGTLCKGT